MILQKFLTQNQVVLAWMMGNDPAVLPLNAASTELQMNENIKTLENVLIEEQMERLDTLGYSQLDACLFTAGKRKA